MCATSRLEDVAKINTLPNRATSRVEDAAEINTLRALHERPRSLRSRMTVPWFLGWTITDA